MSFSRVQSSFTGLPTALATVTAWISSSFIARRPKPPPRKRLWTSTFSGATPAALAASWRAMSGFWVPSQTSTLSGVTRAVQFKGSMGAWERWGTS